MRASAQVYLTCGARIAKHSSREKLRQPTAIPGTRQHYAAYLYLGSF